MKARPCDVGNGTTSTTRAASPGGGARRRQGEPLGEPPGAALRRQCYYRVSSASGKLVEYCALPWPSLNEFPALHDCYDTRCRVIDRRKHVTIPNPFGWYFR